MLRVDGEWSTGFTGKDEEKRTGYTGTDRGRDGCAGRESEDGEETRQEQNMGEKSESLTGICL